MVSNDLTGYYYTKIVKSLRYLEYSYLRIQKLSSDPTKLTDEQFEIWDGFATRFSRSSDLFLSKYLKAAVKKDDPAFDGSFRDFLNRGEKLGVLENTDSWLVIRDLRNVVVHEYSEDDLRKLLDKMRDLTPLLLELRKKLANENS